MARDACIALALNVDVNAVVRTVRRLQAVQPRAKRGMKDRRRDGGLEAEVGRGREGRGRRGMQLEKRRAARARNI